MARRDDDDDAPWLAEAVARPSTEVSKRSLFWTLLVLLSIATVAAIGLVVLLSKKDSGSTQGYMEPDQAPLITAEPGPYKVTPLDPKGMEVEGEGQTIYAAGQGIDQGSIIDTGAGPEAPIPRPGLPQDLLPDMAAPTTAVSPPAAAAQVLAPAKSIMIAPVSPAKAPAMPAKTGAIPANGSALLPAKAAPAPVKAASTPEKSTIAPAKAIITPAKFTPTPAKATPTLAQSPSNPAQNLANPAKKSGIAQLGAFSSVEKANAAWAALVARPALGGFARRIMIVESDGKTLYRLRASGGDAAELCRSLKAAGAPCTVIE